MAWYDMVRHGNTWYGKVHGKIWHGIRQYDNMT